MRTRWKPWAVRVFEWFFRPYMKRRLAGVYVHGLPLELSPQASVMLVANHVSWWDAFLLREVHRQLGGDLPLYIPMLETELKQRPFFYWTGCIALDPTRASSILQSVRFVEAHQPCWMVFFPQGKIWPSWKRPLGFKKGFRLYAQQLESGVILPVGIHLEPMNRSVPTAFLSVGEPLEVQHTDLIEIETRVQEQIDQIHAALAEHGEGIVALWRDKLVL